MAPSDKLSIIKHGPIPMKGRKIAILFDEGSDKAAIDMLSAAIKKGGATPVLVAPKVGGIKVTGGTLKADGQLAGSPSVLFDAVALVLTKAAAVKLASDSAAVGFVMDAFVHLKTIGHDDGSRPLLQKAGVVDDDGVVMLAEFLDIAPQRHWDREPKVRVLP